MISWRGVPDFAHAINLNTVSIPASASAGWRLYPAADEANLFVYLPSELEIALRESPGNGPDELDFSIESVRGVNPFRPPQPYGVLDFRLRPSPFPTEALQKLQQEHPGASVMPALFARGWLRLQLLADTADADDVSAAAGFDAPGPLASNGLDSTRCIRRLTQDQLSLLKRVLQEQTLTFTAWAEMELWGLTPRLALRLDLDPAALLAALRQEADDQSNLPYSALRDFWLVRLEGQAPTVPPITFLDDIVADRVLLAQVLADWTAADFTEMTASLTSTPGFDAPQQVYRLIELHNPPALVRWNLSLEKLVPMQALLRFNPFEAVRQVVEAQGLSSVLTETVVPALETGIVSLTLAANLPDNLQGVLRLGVDLLAPPHPPERVHPLTASLLFDDPQELSTVNWRFSPVEEIEYQYTCFAIVEFKSASGASTIRRLAGNPTRHSGDYLLLSVADFPLDFVPIKASDLLLKEALVSGVCRYPHPESDLPSELAFELNTVQSIVTLCIPAQALPFARLEINARAVAPDAGTEPRVLTFGGFPIRGLRLDLFHLREYGPHTVEVEVEFDNSSTLAVLELLPEDKKEGPEQGTALSFTPDQPLRSWTYFAASPFRAGYLYRITSPTDQPAKPWSVVQSPFDPLKLRASQLTESSPEEENI